MKRQTPWMTGNSFAKKAEPRSERIALRVEPELLESLKKYAEARDMTLSQLVYSILWKYGI